MNTAAAVEQLNKLPVDYSYRMPVELFGTFDKETGKRLSRRVCPVGQIKVISDIYSFDVQSDGNHGICTRTLDQFNRDLNVSESTIRRALAFGVEGFITRSEERKNAYRFNTENNRISGGHYRLEAWMTRPVPINGVLVVLSNAEQAVAAFFNSECNRAPQEFSVHDIAEKLDISEPKVQVAITKLIDKSHKLVHRIRIGVNGHKKSKYIINRELFRKLNNAEKKAQKAKEKARAKREEEKQKNTKPQSSGNVDYKEAIECEYYERKEKRAESVRMKLASAMIDTEFKTTSDALQQLAPKIAFAEARKLPELAKLQNDEKELVRQRSIALNRLGISETELTEDFYIRCSKCRDTLYLPSGGVCRCFSRGSPPE